MKFKKTMIAAAALFLAAAGAVHSQISVNQLALLGQTDLIQIIPGGQPSAQSQYATVPKVTNITGYYTSSPLTNFTYQFASAITNAAFTPAGTLANGYVTLASAPGDGTMNCVYSITAITALNLCTSSTGVGNCNNAGINNPITTLAANATACYFFNKPTGLWNRMR